MMEDPREQLAAAAGIEIPPVVSVTTSWGRGSTGGERMMASFDVTCATPQMVRGEIVRQLRALASDIEAGLA